MELDMLLSGPQINDIISQGVVANAKPENINAASLDVHITDYIMLNVPSDDVVYPKQKDEKTFVKTPVPCVINPGDFFLACTNEWLNLPDNLCAQVVTKSSAARIGLDHATAGFCDSGFSGNITLEFVNHSKNKIVIEPYIKLVQLKFFQHQDAGMYSYRYKGQYVGSSGVVTSKGVK